MAKIVTIINKATGKKTVESLDEYEARRRNKERMSGLAYKRINRKIKMDLKNRDNGGHKKMAKIKEVRMDYSDNPQTLWDRIQDAFRDPFHYDKVVISRPKSRCKTVKVAINGGTDQ